MDKLGNILPRVLAKQPRKARVVEMRARMAVREILGPELAAACETVEIRGSTLTIVTANPALAHQLRIDGESLIGRLNALGLGRQVRELKVRTGRAGFPE